MSALKIVWKQGEERGLPAEAEITVDGKRIFCDHVVVELTPEGSTAVITVLDVDFTYEGPCEEKHKKRNPETGEYEAV